MKDRIYPNYLTGNNSTLFPTPPDHGAYARRIAEEKFQACMNAEQRHIMLLTKEEAYDVLECFGEFGRGDRQLDEGFLNINRDEGLDYLGYAATYSGNAKDFYSAADLVRKLGGFGIAAIIYVGRNGEKLIKITGYPGIRRILNGTRYSLNNMQIVQIGVGTKGINHTIIQGVKWSVYVSLAYRSLEFILSDERSSARFLGSVTSDIAKAIATAAIMRMATPILLGLVVGSIGGAFFVVAIAGAILVGGIEYIDEKFGLTDKIIMKIREMEASTPRVSGLLGTNNQLIYNKI
ncbi:MULTISPECIES: hypothetical protein [Serratia]|uniref:Inner membrane protein yafU n=1 Tax=Serratia fonticola TaxID=47917 RepID=A0ABY9PP44_SERFO|nr:MULTISPECIES: hypothetical protein [Serratia]WMT14548.1 hypothetical protein RFB13_25765 [Serratia fonticola]HEJ9056877.1 hypothetical protein [Serratia fonticola]